jgi:ABC-type multidrug transport system ATPase subunit
MEVTQMVLQARGLVKHYGAHVALAGLDLEVGPGEVFCLLGANGAGKTTTIQLFLGFIEPTAGSARIKGLEVREHPVEARRALAYIPENVMLYPSLTGLENLEYFTTLAGVDDVSPARLRAILARAGLPHDAVERPVGDYSKGMRQKVGIAMAIARDGWLIRPHVYAMLTVDETAYGRVSYAEKLRHTADGRRLYMRPDGTVKRLAAPPINQYHAVRGR